MFFSRRTFAVLLSLKPLIRQPTLLSGPVLPLSSFTSSKRVASNMSIPALSSNDSSSFSRPDECACVALELRITVDFDKKTVGGTAEYKCEKRSVGADVLILDTDKLDITKVYCKESSQNVDFTLSEPVGRFGSKLQINLLSSFDKEFSLCIDFSSAPAAGGLQWMTAEQTLGKRLPYVFSQFQSIFARTMIPCQDTPSVKLPYKAEVSIDERFTVLMSAIQLGCETENGMKKFIYEQKVPIPSYLIAIAAGDLVSKELGSGKCKVWTEPEMIEAAAYEFEETDKMLATAEELCGKYIWGRYDLLVLPPSFPFGGMENPCLTFVTPTLIAGDRSSTSVVAHEIAHSWTGNLVTNKDWSHFWLNEGHTVFVERKIIGRMYGEPQRQFDFIGGWIGLQEDVNSMSKPLTKLLPDLTGVHPDDAFCRVPYDKGAALLYHLECVLGGPEKFEPWLKAYIQKFSGQSITTEQWKKFLYEFFSDKHDVLNRVDWAGWMNTSGMPPLKPDYDYTLYEACEQLCDWWMSDKAPPTDKQDYNRFTTKQKTQFLAQLLSKGAVMNSEKMSTLENLYGLKENKNAEIISRWYQLCIKNNYMNNLEKILQFVTVTGRMKFCRPLYRALYANESTRQKAIDNFLACKDTMHPISATMVAEDLKLIK